MKNLLSIPVIQFALIGLLLFGIQQLSKEVILPDTIEVDETFMQHVRSEIAKMGIENPSEELVETVVYTKIEEELLFRFAEENNLLENNELIKQAGSETAEAFIKSNANLNDPGDAELEKFMGQSENQYFTKRKTSFRQYFFGEDVMYAQKSLFDSKSIAIENSEKTALPERFEMATQFTIGREFGKTFADSLKKQEKDWRGIIESKHGIHVVVVDEVYPSRKAKLEEVREKVLEDYRSSQLITYRDSIIQSLKSDVEVVKTYQP